jgi:hypothetical protein
MLCEIFFSVLTLTSAIAVAPENLSIDELRMIRDAVYYRDPILGSRRDETERVLELPEQIQKLFRSHPNAVLDVLASIMEGASPKDSSLAAAYAFELLDGPGVGVVCVDLFDKKTYDVLDKDWSTTPREHWTRTLRDVRKRGMGHEKDKGKTLGKAVSAKAPIKADRE